MSRLVEKGSKGWRQKREKKLRELAPKFCAHGYKPIMERLVNRVRVPLSQSRGDAHTRPEGTKPTCEVSRYRTCVTGKAGCEVMPLSIRLL